MTTLYVIEDTSIYDHSGRPDTAPSRGAIARVESRRITAFRRRPIEPAGGARWCSGGPPASCPPVHGRTAPWQCLAGERTQFPNECHSME